jgi:hypothetical protein
VQLIAYRSWQIGETGIYHIPKFSKYLQLFFVYLLSELRIKLGLRPLKVELLLQEPFLKAEGQRNRNYRAQNCATYTSEEDCHTPNYK